MWLLMTALLVGVGLGRWLNPGTRIRRVVGWVSLVSLSVLLVALGASFGMSDELMHSLGVLGGRALVLAVAAVAGSVVLAAVLQATLLRELAAEGDGDS